MKDGPAKRGINVRDEFLKFHGKYYSSNIMKLVVLGREDLDTLEKWVVELFEGVKNKDLPDPRFEGQPFTEKELLVCSLTVALLHHVNLQHRLKYLRSQLWILGHWRLPSRTRMKKNFSCINPLAIAPTSLDMKVPGLY